MAGDWELVGVNDGDAVGCSVGFPVGEKVNCGGTGTVGAGRT